MPSIWRSYIPYHIAKDLVSQPGEPPVGREQRFDAVVLFADVSGFTAISEALGEAGRSGTEELTTVLNSYFGPMIALVQSYGGIIGRFGGDAITVLFPYTDDSSEQVACRAIRCALDMQAKMTDYVAIETSAGTFGLAMKAGLAAGSIFCTTVGDPEARLEYVIAGSALDRSADAEHRASKGEVVVHNAICERLRSLDIAERRDGFSKVTGIQGEIGRAPLPALAAFGEETTRIIEGFLHPSVAQRVREGQFSFINEHRRVTVLFVGFESFDYDDDPQVGDKLESYFSKVIDVVKRFGGYLNKVDMGDKGSKYIVLFGAPIAFEDDEERALRCALELRALPDTTVRVGVNTGFVYCGQVGSESRREYTVMGDAVNLSARLMQAAEPGEILVSGRTHDEVRVSFAWEGKRTFEVKGKTGSVDVYPLIGLRGRGSLTFQEIPYALPMVGRETELAKSQSVLEHVLHKRGQILGVTADAGMGKSRLAAEIVKLITEQGLVAFGGECLSHGTTTSYLVWHHLLNDFFGLEPSWRVEEKLSYLETRVAEVDASFVNRIPLLSSPLNLPIPDNDLTRSMDAKLRKSSREALIAECIHHRAREMPLLLIFEDCHWIDPLSNDLLEVIGRNIADAPVLMLVIYRPPETERIQPSVLRFGNFSEIRLSEFTSQEAERLIGLKLANLFGSKDGRRGMSVPAQLVERITERAQGNPFFIDEMVNWIRDQGIEPDDIESLEGFDLPDSLRSLIVSRIDRLREDVKITLKIASVIGRLFRASWLWGVYPELGTPDRVRDHLTQLSQLDITPMDKPEPELEYIFKHIVTRDVAYDTLALATRTMLHGRVGGYFEQNLDDLDIPLDLLAYHYGLSEKEKKKLEYFRKAAEAAQAAYANDVAVDYYQRLLKLLPREERVEVMLKLAEIRQLTGRWGEAEGITQEALKLAIQIGQEGALAESRRIMGGILIYKGDYAEALSWLENARGGLAELGDDKGVAETLNTIGVVYWYLGDYASALAHLQRSQEVGVELNEKHIVIKAKTNLGLVYTNQGDYDRALEAYNQAREIASEIDFRRAVSMISGNMGNIFLELGDYARALQNHNRHLQIALGIGYLEGVSISVGNMGDIYRNQGDYPRATACYLQNLKLALDLGDMFGVSFALWNISKVYLMQRRFQEAEGPLRRAISLARTLDIPYELADYLYTQADVYARQGRHLAAQEVNDEAAKIAGQLDYGTVQFESQILAVRLSYQLSQADRSEVEEAFESLLTEHTAEEERAAIYYELAHLEDSDTSHRETAAGLYQELYAQTPDIRYKQRYESLTGERLEPPPPLPPLPEVVTRSTTNLEALLSQVDLLLKES